jgi:hypothetical protein
MNVLHNQCLALHALAMLMNMNKERTLTSTAHDYAVARATWIYWHAARRVIPAMFAGIPEEEMPTFARGYAVRLPSFPNIAEESLTS